MQHLSGSFAFCRVPALRSVAFLAACLVLLADASASASASAREGLAATPASSSIRSAQFFARDGRWESVSPRSTQDEREQIRAHFAAVRHILTHDTPLSLDIAVARFENALHLSLTPESRAELRDRLASRREGQLDRLRDYSRVGSFPLNRHYSGEARPIFVDARGTHCAVGHLMALDGWEVEVQAIARAKPNVLVRDVTGGPLVSWLLTSGLTREEAALIQPGYYPSTAAATEFSELILPGASLDRNGFRYENFAFSASSTGGATTPTAAQLGLVYGWPPLATTPQTFCTGYSTACVLRPDAFWFGVYASPSSFGNYLYTGANQSISIDIDYDVVALGADLAIGGTETSTSTLYGGAPPGGGTGSLSTTLSSDALGMLVLDVPLGGFVSEGRESGLFAVPADRAHVRHSIQIANGAGFGAFNSVILQAVPAPGTAGLLAFALAVLGRHVRRPVRRRG